MQPQHPRRMINEAVREHSLLQLVDALESVKANPLPNSSIRQLLPSVLRQCVRHGSVDLVRYLLTYEKTPVKSLSPLTVSANPSIALLELLLAHGWDINKAEAGGPLSRAHKLIDLVCNDDHLVRWLVEHGARVADGEVDDYGLFPQPSPLLETCAVKGSVTTFRYLQDEGALLGRRTLHRAVGEAASFGTDPFTDGQQDYDVETCRDAEYEPCQDRARRRERAEMLLFLVDEMKLDINAMDSVVANRAYHWGTPLCYAAVQEKGASVVRWLLEKGAQPMVKIAQNVADSEMLAKTTGCRENARILREWKQAHC
ncbi:hypothetical protein NM208_g622 [Fusarium decemcellulare]|uniref:Uncharacterized protein n=1 Tax=Fusarium decemcellulare TaxID=57161 RepID=A0ACC1SYT1_9HYPO|nr:hypothetical protein NM208_g622 [Fusarium decemcellulare]